MNEAIRSDDFGGELMLGEPMSRHTSWRVGGPADRYYRPAGIDDLSRFLAALPADEPVHWVGLGSNLLVTRRRCARRRLSRPIGCWTVSSGSTTTMCASKPACRAPSSRVIARVGVSDRRSFSPASRAPSVARWR